MAAEHTASHIWHREPFSLSLAPASATEPSHLAGCATFGDALEDEWLITWLLAECTRRIPALTARAWDTDGEFLLIEAAYSLPKWAAKPEATVNRVFLRGGALHLVPPQLCASSELRATISAARTASAAAPPAAAAAVAEAMAGFPGRIVQAAHACRATLPARAAALLTAQPQLVALAVAAFYERHPQSLRAAAKMMYFPPEVRSSRIGVYGFVLGF